MATENVRWEQRFGSFSRALLRLKKYVDLADNLNDLEAEGMIRCFEYTYEMAWKTMPDFLNSLGPTNIHGSRSAFSHALRSRLITDGDVWSQMIDDRNESSHSYEDETTDKIRDAIRKQYYPVLFQFKTTMESIINDTQSLLTLNSTPNEFRAF